VIDFDAIALDVGGVIYYDQPFELAWIHDVLASAQATDRSYTASALIEEMRRFYTAAVGSRPDTVFSRPPARESWHRVRTTWGALVQPIPGAVEATHKLAEHYDLCIVANQPPECAAALEQLGIAGIVRVVALDSVVGYSKPDPRLLGWAFDRLDASAQRTLVVGDRWDHDVVPALAVGCSAAYINNHNDAWSPPPDSYPEIVDAYRHLKRAMRAPAPGASRAWTASGLDELAARLGQCHDEPVDVGQPS
jgi:FMN phosphatase YigB (HAD superfamily)